MITILLPIYKFEESVFQTIEKIRQHVKVSYQIIICFNGDRLIDYKKIQDNIPNDINCISVHTSEKGLGIGLLTGAEKINQEWTLITGHELPFGFSDYDEWLKLFEKFDIIIGSKLHPQTKIEGLSLKRKVISFFFLIYKKILFGNRLPKDTQGTIFIKSELLKKAFTRCKSKDYFITTELLLWSTLENPKIVEVPVVYNHDGSSSVPVIKTALTFIKKLFLLSINFHRTKNERSKLYS